MPPPRRKKGASSPSPASPTRVSLARNSSITQLSPSRSVVVKTPMKSPLRQAHRAGITKNQKAVLLENLNLEITERAKKLRAQYSMQARALKQRIEMRINRVPKKLWGTTMGELLAQSGPVVIAGNPPGSMSTKSNIVTVKEFVEDLKRLSDGVGEKENPQSARIVVPKKRATKKAATASAREQMPPPPIPAAANTSRPLALSPSKSNLPPTSTSPTHLLSSSPADTRIAVKPSTKNSTKATSKTPTRTIRKIIPSNGSQVSNPSRPSSRATTRSSTDTAVTSAGSSHENSTGTPGTKTSQAKTKAAMTTTANSGLKRGGVKGTGSNGSLKENRVAGVKEKKASAAEPLKDSTAAGGRVLRSRK